MLPTTRPERQLIQLMSHYINEVNSFFSNIGMTLVEEIQNKSLHTTQLPDGELPQSQSIVIGSGIEVKS